MFLEKINFLLILVCSSLYGLFMYSEAAAKVMVELLGSYTEDNASQARVDAHRYDLCPSNPFCLLRL